MVFVEVRGNTPVVVGQQIHRMLNTLIGGMEIIQGGNEGDRALNERPGRTTIDGIFIKFKMLEMCPCATSGNSSEVDMPEPGPTDKGCNCFQSWSIAFIAVITPPWKIRQIRSGLHRLPLLLQKGDPPLSATARRNQFEFLGLGPDQSNAHLVPRFFSIVYAVPFL